MGEPLPISDTELRKLLDLPRVAVVGVSRDPRKDSYRVAQYLDSQGYEIEPVNPTATELLGRKAHATLAELKGKVDIVDIFRPSEDVPAIVDAAIEAGAKVIWMQEGIRHSEAAAKARAHGMAVVEDHCLMKEHKRVIHGIEPEPPSRDLPLGPAPPP